MVNSTIYLFSKEIHGPLMAAVNDENLWEIKKLILLGEHINSQSEDGATPFMRAAQIGNMKIIKYFVKKGVNINQLDGAGKNKGLSALHWAINEENLEVIEYLINQGADLHLEDSYGYNVLDYAMDNNHFKAFNLIKSKLKDNNYKVPKKIKKLSKLFNKFSKLFGGENVSINKETQEISIKGEKNIKKAVQILEKVEKKQ